MAHNTRKSPKKGEKKPPAKEASLPATTSKGVGSRGKRKAADSQREGRNVRSKISTPPPSTSTAVPSPARAQAGSSSSPRTRAAAGSSGNAEQRSDYQSSNLLPGFPDPAAVPPSQPSLQPQAPASGPEVSTSQRVVDAMKPQSFVFPPKEYSHSLKLSAKCHVHRFQELFKNLGLEDEKRWFEDHPQFQHIFHMPAQQSRKLQSVNMLLLRTVKSLKKNQAWFVVNGVPIRYSIREHALLTGLSCHLYPANKERLGKMRFVENHFGKTKANKSINVADVLDALKGMTSLHGENRLKMLVLYFLATVLKERAKHKGPIDPFLLRIVDDLEACRTFPWGRYTFEDCIDQIHAVGEHFGERIQEGVSYTFPGFINGLEILAFECIPALDAVYQKPADTYGEECPRMCKRQFKKTGNSDLSLAAIYRTVGDTKDITSVLIPKDAEHKLLSNLLDGMTLFDDELKDDNDRDDAAVDSWNKLLMRDKVKIWWEDLYLSDIECRGRPVEEDEEGGEEEAEEEGQRRVEPIGRGHHQGGLKEEIKKMMELMMKPMQENMERINKTVELMDERLKIVENQQKWVDYNDEYEHGNQFETGGSSFRGNEDTAFTATAADLAALKKKAAEEQAAKDKKAAEEEAAKEKKAAEEKAAKDKKAAEEKAAKEKKAADKAAEEEAAKKKAGEEEAAKKKKAWEEALKKKIAKEKEAKEKKAAEEKEAVDKAAAEKKAAEEKEAVDKAAAEKKAAEEEAAKMRIRRLEEEEDSDEDEEDEDATQPPSQPPYTQEEALQTQTQQEEKDAQAEAKKIADALAEDKRIADDIFGQPSQPIPETPEITPNMKKKLKKWIQRAKTPRPKRETKPSRALQTPYVPK